MAYLDFSTDTFGEPAPVRARSAAPAEGRFSPLEWTAIALARRDSLSSLREPGRLSRALGGLFGFGTQSRLADDRLEALRRLAVNAWHYGYRLPVSEMKSFLGAGFSADQLETALESIVMARSAARERPAR